MRSQWQTAKQPKFEFSKTKSRILIQDVRLKDAETENFVQNDEENDEKISKSVKSELCETIYKRRDIERDLSREVYVILGA